MKGKTYVVVSQKGVACLVLKVNTRQDQRLLKRLKEIATVHERRPKVRINRI